MQPGCERLGIRYDAKSAGEWPEHHRGYGPRIVVKNARYSQISDGFVCPIA